MSAEAVVRQLGPLRTGADVVVAEGRDTPTMRGFRFDVTAREPAFSVLGHGPNAALVYQRFNPARFGDFSALLTCPSQDNRRGKTVDTAEKQWANSVSLSWFARFCETGRLFDAHLFRAIHERRTCALTTAGWTALVVETTGRTAAGLAHAAPCENSGWAFHHTYGFPILPAASLKGLVLHFLLEDWGWATDAPGMPLRGGRGHRCLADIPQLGLVDLETLGLRAASCPAILPADANAQHLAHALFGAAEDGEGAVAFVDAWPLCESEWFEVDVLTPHHLEYYGSESGVPPSDADEPKPHCFLALRNGTRFALHLGLARWARRLAREQREALLSVARAILLAALESWGIGGKTASGYGRMREVASNGSQP